MPDHGPPIGTIVVWAGGHEESLLSPGWLLCNGATYPQVDYPELYKAIRTNWGGSGTADFNVPDLRGQFVRGVSPEETQ